MGVGARMLMAALMLAGPVQAQDVPVEAGELLPLEPRSREFLITAGDRRGEQVRVRLQPSAQDADEWWLSLGRIGRVQLKRTPPGKLVVTQIDLTEAHKRVVYAEPVLLMPARLGPGDVYRAETTARVIDTEENTVRRGRVHHRLEPARRTTLHLPIGTLRGYELRARQVIELDLASVTVELEGGLRRGQGLIYGHVRYSIDKPLFFGSSARHTLELAEPLAPGGG